MNGGVGYITIETSQREGRDARGVGDPSPRARVPFSLGPLGRPILYVSPPPPPPERAVALSEPNFQTHSLQIHCNGPSPKTATLQVYT